MLTQILSLRQIEGGNPGYSLFCGCNTDTGATNQMQFTAYQRPLQKHRFGNGSERSIQYHNRDEEDVTQKAVCGPVIGGQVQQTVHLPFGDFCQLITHKLLRQIEVLEKNTIVENNQQNVSCFFWVGEQKEKTSTQEYDLQEFR